MLTIIRVEEGNPVHSNDPGVVGELLGDGGRQFWLDLEAPTPEEFALLHDVFHFHPLAVEDATRPHQRPKVDEFEGYFFLTVDEISLPEVEAADREILSRQLGVFLGSHYLVTIHIEPVEAVRDLRDRCDRNVRVLERGVDFALYTLLDNLVDRYFPVLEGLDERLDQLEDLLVETPEPEVLQTIFKLKRILTRLRRFVGPLREVLQSLTTRDFPSIHDGTVPYLRDVADHIFRIYETIDSYRDLMSNMLEAYLSQVSNQMNRVMQKLSVVATVFLPLTFVTGVFGMNFSRQPWLHTSFWFWACVMLGMAFGTYIWFRRHRWV